MRGYTCMLRVGDSLPNFQTGFLSFLPCPRSCANNMLSLCEGVSTVELKGAHKRYCSEHAERFDRLFSGVGRLARYSDFCPGLRVSGSGVSCFVAVGCSQSLVQGLWLMGSDFSFRNSGFLVTGCGFGCSVMFRLTFWLTLRIQVDKKDLHWALKPANVTNIGLFESLG